LTDDPILTIEDLAVILRVKPSAARKIVARHKAILRPSRIGRRYYVLRSDVDRLIESRRVSA
jgi:predicted transcriptional regulator of viral defense system